MALILLIVAILNCYAQEERMPLSRLNNEVFYEDLYGDPRPSRYRYPLDVDQNEIGFISPEDEYISGELDYGNKNPDLIMEQVYPGDYVTKNRNKTYKKILLDMMDENDIDGPTEPMKKRVLSSFRERVENEKSKNQREKLAEQFLKKLETEAEERDAEMEYDANREYVEALKELWSKYKNSQGTYDENEPRVFIQDLMKKRQMPEYPPLGWSGVGYKKRESPANYALANEALYRSDDDNLRKRRYEYKDRYENEPEPRFTSDFMYVKRKRNAVTKRSSNYYNQNHHKRQYLKEQYRKKFVKKEHASGTDPKIVKDLKNIFGTVNKTEHLEKKSKVKKNETKVEVKKTSEVPTTTETHLENDKKKRTESNHKDDEHLNIKKKSLDWSNYFGYDRRKKSRNDIDDEWLMDRYNKAIKSAKKSEYPLKIFRNHDEVKRDQDDDEKKKKSSDLQITNESKLGEMDVKLKNIEDLIIDEALKYTGAHEGTTDTKEIQEIKDKVISRLAAAYSLEKMRRALGEFKNSIAAQRNAMTYDETVDMDKKKRDKLEEKRPNDKKFNEEKKEDCGKSENELDSEENQDLSNSVSGFSDYDILERRCRSVARSVTGREQSEFFYTLCKWHQVCYLCNSDDSQDGLNNCDVTFLSKAYILCRGDMVCQWAARPAVEYLRDAYEQTDPSKPFDKSICQNDIPYNKDYMNHIKFR